MGHCSGFLNYNTHLCYCAKTRCNHSNRLLTQTQSSVAENVLASFGHIKTELSEQPSHRDTG